MRLENILGIVWVFVSSEVGPMRHDYYIQAEFNGSDDERPSAYQPRPLKVGAASSSSAPQLSAGDDGKEEVQAFLFMNPHPYP